MAMISILKFHMIHEISRLELVKKKFKSTVSKLWGLYHME